MVLNNILLLAILLATKHFIIDFPLQTKYQYLNKGKYGHPGGLIHAALHALGTFACVLAVGGIQLAAVAAIFDAVVHYHIDWAKTQINTVMGWRCDTREEFWWLLGLDQYLHALTYIGIGYMIFV